MALGGTAPLWKGCSRLLSLTVSPFLSFVKYYLTLETGWINTFRENQLSHPPPPETLR